MSEYTALSSYLDALVGDRNELDCVDIDAKVEERISEMRARARAEVIAEVEGLKHDADVRIEAFKMALNIVSSCVEPEVDEVPEIISDETY